MDEQHRTGVLALKLAQVGEKRRDLIGGVLVDAVQADEGVEDQQPRAQPSERLA